MMRRILALLLAVMCLPLTAFAELEYEREKKWYINFPTLDDWQGHFTRVDTWTIVTKDNLDEHLERVMRRGDSEEVVRARFDDENLIFEAYTDELPDDVCFRFERFENAFTREIWHLRHLDSAERKALIEDLSSGYIFMDRDIYNLSAGGSGTGSFLTGWFTNYPPAVHEGGRVQLHFRNGVLYVLSYCVYGRLSGQRSHYSKKEQEQIYEAPLRDSKFRSKVLPRMPKLEMDETIPSQVDVGDTVTLAGSIEKGSTLIIQLDGKPVDVSVDKKNKFTAVLPIVADGDHEVAFTQTHPKYTTREESFTINASSKRTPLIITAQPEIYALAGEQTIAGQTDPGTTLTLQLDEGENIEVPVDENGRFSHNFTINDSELHTIRLAALAPDKDMIMAELPFFTVFESVKDGIKEFSKKLTEHSVYELAKDPAAYEGERVKISARIHEITFTETGLGMMAKWNAPKSYKGDDIYLYLTLPGYSRDMITPPMIITIYGTVTGPHEVVTSRDETVDGMEIFVEYGTYMK